MSINFAVRYFEVEPGNEEPGSKCKLEHWENYAQTCPNLKINTQRGSQNAAAYRKNGSSFMTFEDEETVSIKVLRYLHGNPAPCIAAFRVDAEDSCGACAAREKASRLMAISRLLSPSTECTSTRGLRTGHTTPVITPSPPSKGPTVVTHGPSFHHRGRALLCISVTPPSNSELLVRLCTHIVVVQPDKLLMKAARSSTDGNQRFPSGYTELLLTRGVAHNISRYDSGFSKVVLRALITMNMDGYALFVSPNTSAGILLKTAMEMRKLFKENEKQKKFTLVTGAQHSTLNEVISELGKHSDYVVVLPDSLEKRSRCLINSSLYFKYDNPMLLDELMKGSGATAMLAVSVFFPVITYDISLGHSDPGDSCIEEHWHGYAVVCVDFSAFLPKL
ncbi:hypothetical protein MRX96_007855 [Rhipicephalus microplus]